MFKRPSSRRKTKKEEIRLNLVPMMDALVTLIAFLLFTMSFLALVSLNSPVPLVSAENNQDLDQKPLQLTMTIEENYVELWSPFDLIKSVRIENTSPDVIDLQKLHTELMQIKERFPTEQNIIFMPSPKISYDALIAIMDATRMIEKTDTPLFIQGQNGVNQEVKRLFPNIVFGNLLEVANQ